MKRSVFAIHIQETASNSCQLSTSKMGRYLMNWLLLAWNHKCLKIGFGHKTLGLKSLYYISIIWKVWQLLNFIGFESNILAKHIRTYPSLSGPIWTCLNLYEHIQTYLNLSGPIWTLRDKKKCKNTYLIRRFNTKIDC